MNVRTPVLRRLFEIFRATDGAQASEQAPSAALSRRDALKLGSVAAAALAAPRVLTACAEPAEREDGPLGVRRSPAAASPVDVGIVGAGIAGLSCATELKRWGVLATVHEAASRVGGRMFSSMNDPLWLGQAFERGGELIDTPHKTMLGYAQALGLALEDVSKPARATFFHFGGSRVSEQVFVDEYRVLVDAMRADLRAIGAPTADRFTPAERELDLMSLAEWLDRRGAPKTIRALLDVAYTIEYGVATSGISCLSFLLFAKASKQSKLRIWGNSSDERYHVIGGNEQIALGLASKLSAQLRLGRRLVAVGKRSDGRLELTFKEGSKTTTATHDAVVLTLPFHLLREVDLSPSLGLPDWKKSAISASLCGNNAKLMIGFAGRPWIDVGGNGAVYSDLPAVQTSWETSPSTASATRGILTDYTGDRLAQSLSPSTLQSDADAFLRAYDVIVPGARAKARKDGRGGYVCHLEHWPSNPLSKGAYTANAPGYFTTIAGNEGKPVGSLYFGGETTDSFYSWQGFMEGGALSGLRAASEVLRDFG